MHYLTVNPIGLFIFNEEHKLINFKVFSKNPDEAAEKLDKFERGEYLPELQEIKDKFKDLITEQPNEATDYFKVNFRKIVLENKLFKSDAELNQFLNVVSIAKSKLKISKIERRDKLIVQVVSALNDLERILNTIMERLREWYGLHYPELDVKDHGKFASLIVEYGNRENFRDFEKSMGMELREEDIKVLQMYAKQFTELYELRNKMDKYLEKIVKEEMVNVDALLGSSLAARMLALAGSLERLAKMPSSSIQLLGAEKSLFKFLKGKEKSRPPRFGILYLHPDISTNKRELQGKIARLLSSKLTIAARTDFYTKKDVSKELLESYKKKLEEILRTSS
jgi:nucleolar protein 56